MSAATCNEGATPPDSPARARPPGCAGFLSLRCRSSLIPRRRDGYAPATRLEGVKNWKQRDMAEFFNRLLKERSSSAGNMRDRSRAAGGVVWVIDRKSTRLNSSH